MVEVTKVKAFCPVLIKLACPADIKMMVSVLKDISSSELAERAGVSSKQSAAFLTIIEKEIE